MTCGTREFNPRQVNTISATRRYQSLFPRVVSNRVLCASSYALTLYAPALEKTNPEQRGLNIAMFNTGKYFPHSIWHYQNQSVL